MSIVGLRNLCTPAFVYFFVSMAIVAMMIFQNYGNMDTYCLGSYNCEVSNIYLVFIIKFIYILFWTWILNLICRSGSPGFAWFLVLLPFVLFFVLITLMMVGI